MILLAYKHDNNIGGYMIEREVWQDIRKYKKTFIGAFTLRETICFVAAAIVCIPSFIFLSKIFIQSAAIFGAALLAVPFVLCGWKEMYGMTFERYIFRQIKKKLTRKTVRMYKSQNMFLNYFDKGHIEATKKEQKEIRKQLKAEKDTKYKMIV